jgi:hypothetical protein
MPGQLAKMPGQLAKMPGQLAKQTHLYIDIAASSQAVSTGHKDDPRYNRDKKRE